MWYKEIKKSAFFAYTPEWEIYFSVYTLLSGEGQSPIFKRIEREKFETWKARYRFLFEAYQAIKNISWTGMQELLLKTRISTFSSVKFEKDVQSLPPYEFIFRYLSWDTRGTVDELKKALTDDATFDKVFQKVENLVENSLAFSGFLRQSERYRREFFALACEIREILSNDLYLSESDLEVIFSRMLQEMKDPLKYSEQLMGKTFHNRGPYSEFYFCPIALLPLRAIRYFQTKENQKRQILFFSPHPMKADSEQTVTILKTISDPMRYRILRLLAEGAPLRGLEIAERLSISTPTVSHHMELLKQNGLINEEPVKNSKYYTLNRHGFSDLIQKLKIDFHIE